MPASEFFVALTITMTRIALSPFGTVGPGLAAIICLLNWRRMRSARIDTPRKVLLPQTLVARRRGGRVGEVGGRSPCRFSAGRGLSARAATCEAARCRPREAENRTLNGRARFAITRIR